MTSKALLRKKYNSAANIDEKKASEILYNVEKYIEANNPKLVGIYLPMEGEIDITSLMIKFSDVKFAAPKIEDDKIFFVRHFLASPVEKNRDYNNYMQPSKGEEVHPTHLFIPAIAFDVRGYRLGRGKGHYDKYLKENNPVKVGLTLNDRILEFIPNEEHDQKMDILISEEVIIDLCYS